MSNKFIELDPPQLLIFQRPFNVPKSRILKIKNITDSTIVFKVKTTAPNNYIVVPNCGEVKVNEVRDVEIKRNVSTEEFPPDFKCKDKFLVQSMKIDDKEISKFGDNPKDLQSYLMSKFQEIDKQKKINPTDVKQILGEDRLTCVYQLPSETTAVSQGNEELASSRESLPNTTEATNNVTAATNIPASNADTTKANNEDELAAAREKIKELQQALKGYQKDRLIQDLTKNPTAMLNERKASQTNIQKRSAPNKNVIPVEVVAIVALIAFLIGAFCF